MWQIRDFVIYSKVCRDSRHIFCQVSPFSRKYSYPFDLESYIKKHQPGVEEIRWIDKQERRERNKVLMKTRGNPFKPVAQQHWIDWQKDAPLTDKFGNELPPLSEEFRLQRDRGLFKF
jgi:hypothetical protein